jgi:hypothetical protein
MARGWRANQEQQQEELPQTKQGNQLSSQQIAAEHERNRTRGSTFCSNCRLRAIRGIGKCLKLRAELDRKLGKQ